MKKVLFSLFAIVALLSIAFVVVNFFVSSPAIQEDKVSVSETSAIILPHFDLARQQRQAFEKKLSSQTAPKKIVILSVDHFGDGGQITTTNKDWDFGDLKPIVNRQLFDSLVSKGVKDNQSVFSNEHGIKNVFPELAKTYPKAEFLPVIIGSNLSIGKTDDFFTNLYDQCSDCLIVGSVDFSHYNPNSLAQIHDEFALSALQNLDEKKAFQAETDSPQILYIISKWAKAKGDKGFEVFAKGNSGEEAKNDQIETTSYIMGQFSKQISTEKSTTFILGGDVMFDRLINHQFLSSGVKAVFANFGPRVFWGADISGVNLEGPISKEAISDDVSTDNLVFNFPPNSIEALKYLKLNTVSLANNHTSNAGSTGLENTKSVLSNAGIRSFGEPTGLTSESVARFDSGIPTSLIGIDLLANYDLQSLCNKIKAEKEAGYFVIVYPHWGNEYQTTHSSAQRDLAEKMIDSGADLIIGSHPHVVQDMQIYKGKPIIYSLGNLVFDQTFSKETQQGMLCGGKIYQDHIELSFFPTEQINLKPQFARDDRRLGLLNRLFANNDLKFLGSDTIILSR